MFGEDSSLNGGEIRTVVDPPSPPKGFWPKIQAPCTIHRTAPRNPIFVPDMRYRYALYRSLGKITAVPKAPPPLEPDVHLGPIATWSKDPMAGSTGPSLLATQERMVEDVYRCIIEYVRYFPIGLLFDASRVHERHNKIQLLRSI